MPCVAVLRRGGAEWRLLATRSAYRIDWEPLVDSVADRVGGHPWAEVER